MKLALKNIGKIGEASVEIKGITVIAGENNTGKSTVSRALFAVFSSFFNIRKRLEDDRINRVRELVEKLYFNMDSEFGLNVNTKEISEIIVSQLDEYREMELFDVQNKIYEILSKHGDWSDNSFDNDIYNGTILQICEILKVTNQDFIKLLLRRQLNVEFNEQICNIFSEHDGEIELQIKESNIEVTIESGGDVSFKCPDNFSLRTEAIYIDNPFVIDDLRWMRNVSRYRDYSMLRFPDHQEHLTFKLSKTVETNVFDEIIAEDKLKDIYEKISSICSGDVVYTRKSTPSFRTQYRKKGSDKVLNIRNLSAGLKTFVILKMLLVNGVIERNGTIILDEPEIHLHPEWQLLFAELIVLIQKQFGVHILLNTHSPYFLNALEVYSTKYDISDRCKYYLASLKGDVSMIEDVTDHVDLIYKKLAAPFQKLENERGRL